MLLASCVVWLVCAAASFCVGVETGTAGEPTDDAQQVLATAPRLREALLGADIQTVKRLWATDYVLTTRLGRVLNRQERLESLETGKLKYLEIELADVETRRRPGVVVVTGRSRGRTVRNNVERSIGWKRYTAVWVKEEDGWRLLARHASEVSSR